MSDKNSVIYWQNSDKVPATVIVGVTDKCERQDCNISARILETTLAGTQDNYDKNGHLRIINNNRFTAQLCCVSCKKGWLVDNEGNVL